MDVIAAFVTQAESAEAVQPREGALDDPPKDAQAAAVGMAGLSDDGDNALRREAGVTGPRPVAAVPLHDVGLAERSARATGDRR